MHGMRVVEPGESPAAGAHRSLQPLYHAAGPDQALAILDDLNLGWQTSQQHALDLRFELRDSMTEAEWAALFGGE